MPSRSVPNRYDSIDVMRALAIALMIPCHFLLFLSPADGNNQGLYQLGNDILGGLAAPLFLFLLGVSQAVSLQRKPSAGPLLDETGVRMLKRGLAVFVIGMLFQIPIEGPPYEWDVLPFIGFSIVVLCFVRRWPGWALLAAAAAVYLAAPWLRGYFGYLDQWTPAISPKAYMHGVPDLFMDPLAEYRNGADPHLSVMALGFFVTGYFPCFPWLLFPLAGYALGRLYFAASFGSKGESPLATTTLLGGVGLVFMACGAAIGVYATRNGIPDFESGFLTALTYFPASPSWLLIQFGFCLVTMSACRLIFDAGRRREGSLLAFSRTLSRYSLTTYILHYLVAYWPARIAEIMSGDHDEFLGNWVNPPAAWLWAFAALAGFYGLFRLWDKVGGKFSLEWLLARIDSVPSPSNRRV